MCEGLESETRWSGPLACVSPPAMIYLQWTPDFILTWAGLNESFLSPTSGHNWRHFLSRNVDLPLHRSLTCATFFKKKRDLFSNISPYVGTPSSFLTDVLQQHTFPQKRNFDKGSELVLVNCAVCPLLSTVVQPWAFRLSMLSTVRLSKSLLNKCFFFFVGRVGEIGAWHPRS